MGTKPGFAVRLKRLAIFVHRWLGVALCVMFLIWFPSGIGIMYWDYPSVSPADRLERSPVLDASKVRLSPEAAYAAIAAGPLRDSVRLNSFDGRPVYRFRNGGIVYADTGETQSDVSPELMSRIAAAWTSQPATAATIEPIEEMDQWTLGSVFRARPLWKYSWPDGEQVYVSQRSGEVVQYTTTGSRLGAYVGAIPHWLYFTPLRRHAVGWRRAVIWSSGAGAFAAALGVAIGLWMYSPSKRYRHAGAATSIPYRGRKRWHAVCGLLFGLGAVTWAFSGMLSLEPFPLSGGGAEKDLRGLAEKIPEALGGSVRIAAFASKPPRLALAELGTLPVKELELVSVGGNQLYLARLAGGETYLVPLDGPPEPSFDTELMMDLLTRVAGRGGLAEIRVLDQYDAYYLDRHRALPLPVILVRLTDSAHTRYYINPKTGRVVGGYSSERWMERWLYHGLHSFDFPWLYNHRPLWDIVVLAFMLGGTALGVTALMLAWGVLGRTIRSAMPGVSDGHSGLSDEWVADGE